MLHITIHVRDCVTNVFGAMVNFLLDFLLDYFIIFALTHTPNQRSPTPILLRYYSLFIF